MSLAEYQALHLQTLHFHQDRNELIKAAESDQGTSGLERKVSPLPDQWGCS